MKGKVYLVGAGPGKVDLITVRGKTLLKRAEVLVYDRLANPELLEFVPKSCEVIYVGKVSNQHTMKQDDINQLLVDKAFEGKTVVRLKGGDPYVFGRGGEEGIVLSENDITFEVVPGITSAIGGLCYGGIPITHRDVATSFHVITGHLKSGEDEHDWDALARLNGTLVFLMGMSNLPLITKKLMAHNKSVDTPVGIIHWATHHNQQVVEGTLHNIVEKVEVAGIGSPSLIVVGDVVRLRKHLNFKEKLPLDGKSVLITRATNQTSGLKSIVEELGARTILRPMIQIEPIKDLDTSYYHKLKNYQYIVFTSINGVKLFFDQLFKENLDVRSLSENKIICIGKPTEKALRQYGLVADYMPGRFVAEGLLELMTSLVTKDDHVLIPRAKNARPLLVEKLSQLTHVDEFHLYESKPTENSITEEDVKSVDYITFTSASTVTNFHAQKINPTIINSKMVSIGPITSEKLRSFGYAVDIEANEHTIDGLVKVILQDAEENKDD